MMNSNLKLFTSNIFLDEFQLEILDKFDDDLRDEFEDLRFDCHMLERNTTIHQFQNKLKVLYDEIRDHQVRGEPNPISLLYVIVTSHGSHRGAIFADGRESHIVTELRHILGLESMNKIPVILNASFCRDREDPKEVLETPMANIATDHVSFQFWSFNHKRCSKPSEKSLHYVSKSTW